MSRPETVPPVLAHSQAAAALKPSLVHASRHQLPGSTPDETRRPLLHFDPLPGTNNSCDFSTEKRPRGFYRPEVGFSTPHDPRRSRPRRSSSARGSRLAGTSERDRSRTAAPARDRGDWATPVALALRPIVGGNPLELAERIAAALEGGIGAPFGPRRGREARLREPLPRADVAPRRAASGRRRRRSLRDRHRARPAAASTSSSCRPTPPARSTPVVAAGSRSATRSPTCSRRRAPRCTASTTSTTPATSSTPSRARSTRAYRGEAPPDDGYQGEYLVEMADAHARRARRRRVTEDACEWGYRDVVAQTAGRPRAHRRALRHLVLGAHAARARRGRRRARDARRARRDVRRRRRGAGCGRPTSATSAIVCSCEVRRHDDVSLQRPRVPPRQVRPRAGTHLIDIWGADHHGQVKSLQVGHAKRSGTPPAEPEVMLGQLVKLVRGGEEVRMSKRAGNIVTLADILDEVDPDVARLTFLLQSIDTAQTFDLDIVTVAVDGEPRLLRAVRARAHRVDRPPGRRGAASTRCRRSTRRPRAARARARARAAARARGVSRRGRRGGRARGRRTASPPGCATSPSAFHGFYRDCRVHHRRRRAHPGPAVAGGGVPHRSGQRARPSSACTRPTRCHGSTTTTTTTE